MHGEGTGKSALLCPLRPVLNTSAIVDNAAVEGNVTVFPIELQMSAQLEMTFKYEACYSKVSN